MRYSCAVLQDWARREAELRAEAASAAAASEVARGALAKLRKDHEGERERVKKVIGDMKKKIDRCGHRVYRVLGMSFTALKRLPYAVLYIKRLMGTGRERPVTRHAVNRRSGRRLIEQPFARLACRVPCVHGQEL